MPMQATPLLQYQGGPATGGGRGRVEGDSIPSTWRLCGKALRRSITSLTQYHYWSPCGSHLHLEESSQMEEGLGFSPALKQLQGINQARVQLEWELAHEAQGLAREYEDWQIRLARGMRNGKPTWPKRQMLPSRRSSLMQAQPTQSSCYPHVSPLQFPMLHGLSTDHHCATGRGCPNIYHCTWAGGLTGSCTPQTVQLVKLELHLFQCLPLLGIPFVGTPLSRVPISSIHWLAPCRKSGTALPAAPSVINATQWTCVNSQRGRG